MGGDNRTRYDRTFASLKNLIHLIVRAVAEVLFKSKDLKEITVEGISLWSAAEPTTNGRWR